MFGWRKSRCFWHPYALTWVTPQVRWIRNLNKRQTIAIYYHTVMVWSKCSLRFAFSTSKKLALTYTEPFSVFPRTACFVWWLRLAASTIEGDKHCTDGQTWGRMLWSIFYLSAQKHRVLPLVPNKINSSTKHILCLFYTLQHSFFLVDIDIALSTIVLLLLLLLCPLFKWPFVFYIVLVLS